MIVWLSLSLTCQTILTDRDFDYSQQPKRNVFFPFLSFCLYSIIQYSFIVAIFNISFYFFILFLCCSGSLEKLRTANVDLNLNQRAPSIDVMIVAKALTRIQRKTDCSLSYSVYSATFMFLIRTTLHGAVRLILSIDITSTQYKTTRAKC